MAFFQPELSWFSQLGRLASSVSGLAKKSHTACQETSPLADAEWKSFDSADVMEAGMARELTVGFITAPPPERTQRLVVERSKDRTQHLLKSESGELLVLALCDEEDYAKVNFYLPTGGDPPVALGPAFQLEAQDNELRSWSLTTHRCKCCEYLPVARSCRMRAGEASRRRQLARISQTREEFGQCGIMTIEVELPTLRPDGSPNFWCENVGRSDESERILLESRRPRWNSQSNTLTLDFHGRCNKASIQNFQLDVSAGCPADENGQEDVAAKLGEPEMLFGRIGSNRFVLDYKRPLGMVQAFAIALTTNLWQ